MKPTVIIEYCLRCGWMLRSAYMAQELLTTFTEDLEMVALKPSGTTGSFTISVNDQIIFNRKNEGRFPEIKELKQLVRDIANPSKDLGHSENR